MAFYLTTTGSLRREKQHLSGRSVLVKPDLPPKNRVRGFLAIPVHRTRCFGPQPLAAHRGNRPTPTKTASGLTCWLFRDPIGESGGENIYAFVGNDSISLVDPLGLKWTVKRDYQSQADADCDCNDTVDDLAKKIDLDPGEFAKWLTSADGKGLPSSSSEKITEARKFKVPNEAHLTQGNLGPSYGLFDVYAPTKTRKDSYVSKYKKQKYAVKDHFTAGEAGNALGDITGALGNKDIAVWAHFGHGDSGMTYSYEKGRYSTGTPGFLLIGTPVALYGPASFTPHHKLSEVVLFSCHAGKNKGWFNLVAPGGTLYSSDDVINPGGMGWPWVHGDTKK